MMVGDIVKEDVYSIEPKATLNEVASMMKRHGVGVIPVCDGGHLLGVITDRDIVVSCVAAGMNPASCQANEFMTSQPIAVTPDTDIEQAALLMSREQIRRLPVVSGDNLVGMISLGDIAMTMEDDSTVAETLRKVSAAP